MRPLIEELPRHYGASPQDAELQRVLWRVVSRAEADLDFTLDQLFASSASGWGLELWENAFGLQREPGQTEALRRARVLAKVRGASPSTVEQIRAVVQTFAAWPAEVREFPREYRFEVWFSQGEAALDRREALRSAVNERKPAHLTWMLGESFQPGVFRTEPGADLVRFQAGAQLPNLWGAVLFNGRRRFDGAVRFDQRISGMTRGRMKVQLSVRTVIRLSGRLARDWMWRLDGSVSLNGQRRLNAGTKEEFDG